MPLSSLSRPAAHADGSTLPATMMVVAVILAFLSAAALLTSQDSRFAARQESKADTLTAADAALDYAYSQWKTTVVFVVHGKKITTSIPAASTWDPATLLRNFKAAYANPGAFAANTGVLVNSLSIISTDQNGQHQKDKNGKDVSSTDAPTGIPNNNVTGYPGWNGTTYNYMASVMVSNPNHFASSTDDGMVTVNRYFQVTTVPLFQAAIFYENDLELHPGAKMVVTGLVHSNANIYALGYLAQVQFMSNVSYVGTYQESSNPSVRYGWDGANNNSQATPEIANASTIAYYNKNYGTNLPPDYFSDLWSDGKPSDTSTTRAGQINQVSTIDPFGGANQSNNGLHDIVEVPPATNTSDQIAYNNATLKIIINSSLPTSNPLRYIITDGSNIPLAGTDRTNVINALTATAPTTITDLREASTAVTVTSLDMAQLAYATIPSTAGTASNTTVLSNTTDFVLPSKTYPASNTAFQQKFTGTVYIHDVAPTTAATRTAIRLVNGRKLGQDVSVATDNGLYIQGDYNTGGTQASDVPTNGTGSLPQATGYTRHSSAVMADAVTILSNSWSDSNSGAAVGSRNATATTVNTAILAGDVPSNAVDANDPNGNGIASGGAHNFPRFLETWSNINFTYTGSLVEAFRSEKFTGSWQTNNVYKWPNRPWSFDTNFIQKQPPGVPTGIQFTRGRYERAVN